MIHELSWPHIQRSCYWRIRRRPCSRWSGIASVEGFILLTVLLVQHISPSPESYMATHFDSKSHLSVQEAEDKLPIRRGNMYIAPPNYHMMVEVDGCIALSVDPPVNYSRPSIDVLFETAADYYGPSLVGVVLTGANSDGALGLKNQTNGRTGRRSIRRKCRGAGHASRRD